MNSQDFSYNEKNCLSNLRGKEHLLSSIHNTFSGNRLYSIISFLSKRTPLANPTGKLDSDYLLNIIS
jgi:hypothetical protein